jgi:hypothetical protein
LKKYLNKEDNKIKGKCHAEDDQLHPHLLKDGKFGIIDLHF